jgi:DNA polymerase elongation subunit (family B)
MTPEEIAREYQYRYLEALGIGRNEARAKSEADEWRRKVTEDK